MAEKRIANGFSLFATRKGTKRTKQKCRWWSPPYSLRKPRKKYGGETPTDARSSSAAPRGCGRCPHPDPPPLAGEGMGGGSTSIGVPPRFSSQGVFHRKGLSTRPSFLGRGGKVWPLRRAGVTRPYLSQSSEQTRPGRSARGWLPNAARERLARPRAGAALARASRGLPPRPRPSRTRFEAACNRISDQCQYYSDD